MSIIACLLSDRLEPEKELAALLDQADGDGAIVSFTGLARSRSAAGRVVVGLVLEHHPTLTLQSLEDIAASAAGRFEVSHVRVVHRSGAIAPGEAIVFAGATSLHRRAAFEAADFLMDRLKTEAVFWKREVLEDGSSWIEPTEGDYEDRERWG